MDGLLLEPEADVEVLFGEVQRTLRTIPQALCSGATTASRTLRRPPAAEQTRR